jgi:uncharacterized protein YbjT (DUF2867 family)
VPISPRDIALVAARALVESGHTGKTYELTGEHPITVREQVAILARVLGRELTCVSVSPDIAADNARKRGMPEAVVATLRTLWIATAAGQAGFRNDTFRSVTGQPAETFETWAAANVAAFA